MSIKNYSAFDRQLHSLGVAWKDTARQQTVHLGDDARVIVTEDRQGRISVMRTDRHGTAVARAEL